MQTKKYINIEENKTYVYDNIILASIQKQENFDFGENYLALHGACFHFL